MSKMIDISSRLTNERPQLKLAEDKIYDIDDRKNTVIKFEQDIQSKDISEIGVIDEMIELFLGEKARKEIDAMELSLPVYQAIMVAIMASIQGVDFEVAEARFRKEAGL